MWRANVVACTPARGAAWRSEAPAISALVAAASCCGVGVGVGLSSGYGWPGRLMQPGYGLPWWGCAARVGWQAMFLILWIRLRIIRRLEPATNQCIQ